MKPESLCINNDAHYCSDEFLCFLLRNSEICVFPLEIETFFTFIVVTLFEMFFWHESGVNRMI